MRMLQLSHDGNAAEASNDSDEDAEEDGDENSTCGESAPLDTKWEDFVQKESRKRWVTVVLD